MMYIMAMLVSYQKRQKCDYATNQKDWTSEWWRKKNVSFIQIKIPICVPSSRTGYCEPVNSMNKVEWRNSRMLIRVCVFPASSCSAIKVSGPITWLGALILNLELFSQHHNSAVSKIPRHGKLLSVSSVNNWKPTCSKSLKACHSFSWCKQFYILFCIKRK